MIEIFRKVFTDVHFLGAFVQTVTIILLGFIFRRRNIIDSAGKKAVTVIVWKIAVPCLAFSAFMQDFNAADFIAGTQELALAAVFYAFLMLTGKILFYKRGRNFSRLCALFIAVGQTTLFSMPVLQSVYAGRESGVMFYVNTISIVFRVMVYIVGFYVISGERITFRLLGPTLKKIFVTPIMIGMFGGIIIWLLQKVTPQVQTPAGLYSFLRIDKTLPALYQAVVTLSRLVNPLAMFLVGLAIGESDFASALTDKTAWIIAFFRNFFAPAAVLAAVCVMQAAGIIIFTEYSLIALVISFAAPVSVSLNLFCMQYHNEEMFASRVCLVSTLLSIVSIPLNFVFSYYMLSQPFFSMVK